MKAVFVNGGDGGEAARVTENRVRRTFCRRLVIAQPRRMEFEAGGLVARPAVRAVVFVWQCARGEMTFDGHRADIRSHRLTIVIIPNTEIFPSVFLAAVGRGMPSNHDTSDLV